MILYCNVMFSGSKKKYQYKTCLSDLIEGDRIIVEARDDWASAIFVDYLPKCTLVQNLGDGKEPISAEQFVKWIVAKIDPETYEEMHKV